MDRFLQAIVDFIGTMFGDTPQRPRTPASLPPGLPPAEPVPPRADPNEPQDSADLSPEDPVIVNHEMEETRDEDGQEYEPVSAPPPLDETEENAGPSPSTGGPTPPGPEHRVRYLWCIDNGHGALTRGKRSPVLEDGRQLLEYEFNRDVASRIFTRLDQIGIAYFEVVPEVQVGNFLKERVRRVNHLSSALPKLLVSIHANAGPAASLQDYTGDGIRGIETWFFHRSTKGRNMAAIFQRHLIKRTGLKNRHLRSKVRGQFYVLRASRMPAILTENGFYNNRIELPLMLTDAFRQQVADAHVSAILEIEASGL